MADGLGFEPRQTAPEAVVLPLHYPSVIDHGYYTIRQTISTFFLNLRPLILKRHYTIKDSLAAGARHWVEVKISQTFKLISHSRYGVFNGRL